MAAAGSRYIPCAIKEALLERLCESVLEHAYMSRGLNQFVGLHSGFKVAEAMCVSTPAPPVIVGPTTTNTGVTTAARASSLRRKFPGLEVYCCYRKLPKCRDRRWSRPISLQAVVLRKNPSLRRINSLAPQLLTVKTVVAH
jgi:hypothetical protein